MTTSPTTSPLLGPATRAPIRLLLRDGASADHLDGAWWPQSRDLQTEAADLVDHFPPLTGYINRLLFSRPDWDNPVVDGRGIRRIRARRGPVKVGSFPSDDTHLMVLTLSTGQRLRIRVIPPDTDSSEAQRQMHAVADAPTAGRSGWQRWDDEHPRS